MEKSVVLEVVLYKTNQELIEKIKVDPLAQIICPSPVVADNLRGLLPNADILTISKWSSDHLKRKKLTRARKADLMLRLAAVWRHYFPRHKSYQFKEAFELFTELRSFTLNLELLSEFFKELEDDLVKALLVFWTFVDQEKLVDEHLGYLHVGDSEINRQVIFAGFKHMSGVQIDMLKKISEKGKVAVFFPQQVYAESLPNDWVKWLSQDESPAAEEDNKAPLNTIVLSRGKANVVANEFFQDKSHDIIMATHQTKFLNVQELHSKGYFFKAAEDIFSTKYEKMFEEFREHLKNSGISTVEEVRAHLLELGSKCLAMKDYRQYKLVELAVNAVDIYGELQSAFDGFALDIVGEVVLLNSPRTSLISLEKEPRLQIVDMNGISFRVIERPTAVIATSGMGSFRTNEKILSEAMSKALRPIGPIKRSGLDFLFNKHDLMQVLFSSQAWLLIEEDLLESDLAWRDILKSFSLAIPEFDKVIEEKKVIDYLAPKVSRAHFERKHYSASSLQAYIDCPRKFYFNYVSKVDSRPLIKSALTPDELGKLEHRIIAEYFNKRELSMDVDLVFHRSICVQNFSDFLSSEERALSRSDHARGLNEILHYTLNGIIFLNDFIKSNRASGIIFEMPLPQNPWSLVGSIDCVVELPESKVAVFDFKRSSTAAGSKEETTSLKKIQIWVYLLVLNWQKYDVSTFGYLNLSDIADTKLIFSNEESSKIMGESMMSAQDLVERTIQNLQQDQNFYASPRNFKVCHFCSVGLYCHKGSLHEC